MLKYRNDIQGLRALAVIFVFIFHLSHHFLPGGFIGVDMFFVISGYLISKIILSKIDKNEFDLWDFYVSRLKRIVPAYFFLLIAVWIAFFFIFINADIGKFKLAHFWAILFNSNYHFANVDDYFGVSSNENPLLHTWTLGVEMQFYLILPLLLFIKNRRILFNLLLLLTVGLFSYSTYEIFFGGNASAMYFSLLARSPEFFIGVLISLLSIDKHKFVIKNSFVLSILGVLGLGLSVIFLKETLPFPGLLAVLPCLSVACLLVTPTSKVNAFLSNKIFTYIGEISYSVYLWHWPIIAFFRYYYNRYDLTLNEIIIIVFLTITTSLCSYYLIEKPLRHQKRSKFYIPLATMFAINLGLVYYVVPIKFKTSPIPLKYIYPSFAMDSHSDKFKKVGIYGNKLSKNKRILLLGDSHALSFIPYLHTLGQKESFSIRTLTNDSYPTLPGLSKKEIIENNRYKIYKNLEPHIISEIDSADVIIVFFTGKGTKFVNPIKEFLSKLKDNQKVLFIPDYPTLNINPVRINRSHIKDATKKFEYKTKQSTLNPDIIDLIKETPNARLVNLSRYNSFFDDAPFYKDTLMYYDSNHLNYYGSKSYQEVSGKGFMKYLEWAID